MSAFSGDSGGRDHATGQLLAFVVRYRGRYVAGLSCVVLTTAVTLAAPWVLKHAVDDLSQAVTEAKLLLYGGAYSWRLPSAGGVLRYATRLILIGTSRAIEYDIRNAFFGHLQRLPLALFQRQPHGRPDVARHQRSQRREDDGRAGSALCDHHRPHVRGGARVPAVAQRAADTPCLVAAAAGHGDGTILRPGHSRAI